MIRSVALSLAVLSAGLSLARAQDLTLTGRIDLVRARSSASLPDPSNVVVWLTPLNGSAPTQGGHGNASTPHAQLVQANKRFDPRVLAVPVGTAVEFPNRDPFFHNVFSLFAGKRFDLGLYEAGGTRLVRFNRPGVSYIFCNIHPEMSAVVVALDTPYHAISDKTGRIMISGVPSGRYQMQVWSELVSPEALQGLTREVTVSEGGSSLGTIRVVEGEPPPRSHKNKYGRDYDRPSPPSPIYDQK